MAWQIAITLAAIGALTLFHGARATEELRRRHRSPQHRPRPPQLQARPVGARARRRSHRSGPARTRRDRRSGRHRQRRNGLDDAHAAAHHDAAEHDRAADQHAARRRPRRRRPPRPRRPAHTTTTSTTTSTGTSSTTTPTNTTTTTHDDDDPPHDDDPDDDARDHTAGRLRPAGSRAGAGGRLRHADREPRLRRPSSAGRPRASTASAFPGCPTRPGSGARSAPARGLRPPRSPGGTRTDRSSCCSSTGRPASPSRTRFVFGVSVPTLPPTR